ncbi:hypothetical protein ABW19_dt0205160 [Dactylella cylindrospora]|nr:hypothetical protein ABW19_dt0205160 [Dactylella cylindrospora]
MAKCNSHNNNDDDPILSPAGAYDKDCQPRDPYYRFTTKHLRHHYQRQQPLLIHNFKDYNPIKYLKIDIINL